MLILLWNTAEHVFPGKQYNLEITGVHKRSMYYHLITNKWWTMDDSLNWIQAVIYS